MDIWSQTWILLHDFVEKYSLVPVPFDKELMKTICEGECGLFFVKKDSLVPFDKELMKTICEEECGLFETLISMLKYRISVIGKEPTNIVEKIQEYGIESKVVFIDNLLYQYTKDKKYLSKQIPDGQTQNYKPIYFSDDEKYRDYCMILLDMTYEKYLCTYIRTLFEKIDSLQIENPIIQLEFIKKELQQDQENDFFRKVRRQCIIDVQPKPTISFKWLQNNKN
ncbi:MAG: hypothetical protein Satyrvirus21_15 [Satyrvirus sp.]|uniref:Uncharacterized protein n=1 Tax=Satyrvirus sp. TaxID=2487771 RepID=A0A3G5AGV3_9VIRU|nr:MAG: hypothetical protein Satyrvirus21_15 [Satyrvirus sp.]